MSTSRMMVAAVGIYGSYTYIPLVSHNSGLLLHVNTREKEHTYAAVGAEVNLDLLSAGVRIVQTAFVLSEQRVEGLQQSAVRYLRVGDGDHEVDVLLFG